MQRPYLATLKQYESVILQAIVLLYLTHFHLYIAHNIHYWC